LLRFRSFDHGSERADDRQYPIMSANPQELLSAYAGVSKPATAGSVFRLERRKRVRTRVHWRVLFFRDGSTEAIESLTQNLSSSGFYCLSRSSFSCGDSLICALEIPTHDPSGTERSLALECQIRVLRAETVDEKGIFGIACQIEDYRFPTGHVSQREEAPEA
jgi:hypothetical protein